MVTFRYSLTIILNENIVSELFCEVERNPGYQLTVDLPCQRLVKPDSTEIVFDIDPFYKQCLLEGLDEIGLTLKQADAIRAYEAQHEIDCPWLFHAIK
jgi:3-isopropylmalate/(R)-2-methylmalate dehydratase small subunit